MRYLSGSPRYDSGQIHTLPENGRKRASIGLAAEYPGHTAGYVNLYPNRVEVNGGIYCEIADFGVLEKYRRKA